MLAKFATIKLGRRRCRRRKLTYGHVERASEASVGNWSQEVAIILSLTMGEPHPDTTHVGKWGSRGSLSATPDGCRRHLPGPNAMSWRGLAPIPGILFRGRPAEPEKWVMEAMKTQSTVYGA